jgi:hypothetical protein
LHEKDIIYFEKLKQEIVAVMQQSYPGINPSIGEWKGQEITDFQEDLRLKVNANISDKWFYTHFKTTHSTLPRIDMLTILCRYAGYSNWDDFVHKHNPKDTVQKVSANNPNRYFILVPVLALVIVGVFWGLFKLFNTQVYTFTFIDADTRETIANTKTEIILISDGESPVHFLTDKDGCFRLKTDKSKISMVVNSPCYHSDTLIRIVTKLNRNETIMLKPDDYALMIHYFSTMKVDDWEKRRERLNKMIADDAMICQVFRGKETAGMALYNKQEFIDKLTMPAGSLKNIEILSSQSRYGKIVVLRFRTNNTQK